VHGTRIEEQGQFADVAGEDEEAPVGEEEAQVADEEEAHVGCGICANGIPQNLLIHICGHPVYPGWIDRYGFARLFWGHV
jgi:NAD-dependent dihydropyrimidine dehydrogenase PreA subunit